MPLLSCFVHAQTASCCIEKSATLSYPHSGLESCGPPDPDVTTPEQSPVVPAGAGVRRPAGRHAWLPPGMVRSVVCLGFATAAVLFSGFAGAQKQRVVNYFNWSDYQDPIVLDAFTKETGIAVRFDTFASHDTLEAKLLAGYSGYDVVVPSAYFLARHQGWNFSEARQIATSKSEICLARNCQAARHLRPRQSVCGQLHVGHDRDRLQCQNRKMDFGAGWSHRFLGLHFQSGKDRQIPKLWNTPS